MREQILCSIAAISSAQLAAEILNEHDELIGRFAVGDHRPSELSGGRFAEAAFRVCQQVCCGKHIAIGKTLPRVDKLCLELENTSAASCEESFRIHIPRALRTIYDFRNKRDVAHLGSGVEPNLLDSTLIVSIANWVMAEIVRVAHQCDPDEAQGIVDALCERRIPVVWQDGDIIRVMDPALTYKDKTLVVLYCLDPARPTDRELFAAVEYSRFSAYCPNVLDLLHAEAMVDYREDRVVLLPPGKRYVEREINLRHV